MFHKMSERKRFKVVVIGAGVAGLSTAVVLQQSSPDIQVEIVSEVFSPDTTSDGSAGFWEPYAVGSDMKRILKLSATTFEHLNNLAYSPQAPEAGVQLISGYTLLADEHKEDPGFKNIVHGFRRLSSEELARFPLIEAKAGYFFTSVQVDVSTYLPWLLKRFLENGGKTRKAKVTSLNEIADECDLIVTCCSLGARELLNDQLISPTRGQVFRVEAPWIKHFYFFEPKTGLKDFSYILPGTQDVVVGGTAQVDDWRTTIDERDSKKIWDSAVKLVPMLSKAKVLRQWAGLRPSRDNIRLEKETLEIRNKKIKVVHNYGLGGAGVTMHWGCALEAANLVMESLGVKYSSSLSRL